MYKLTLYTHDVRTKRQRVKGHCSASAGRYICRLFKLPVSRLSSQPASFLPARRIQASDRRRFLFCLAQLRDGVPRSPVITGSSRHGCSELAEVLTSQGWKFDERLLLPLAAFPSAAVVGEGGIHIIPPSGITADGEQAKANAVVKG